MIKQVIDQWYINKCIENGWSRTVMIHQIETGLYNKNTISKDTINNKTLNNTATKPLLYPQ